MKEMQKQHAQKIKSCEEDLRVARKEKDRMGNDRYDAQQICTWLEAEVHGIDETLNKMKKKIHEIKRWMHRDSVQSSDDDSDDDAIDDDHNDEPNNEAEGNSN